MLSREQELEQEAVEPITTAAFSPHEESSKLHDSQKKNDEPTVQQSNTINHASYQEGSTIYDAKAGGDYNETRKSTTN